VLAVVSFIEAFWRRNQPSGDRTRRDDIDYHVLAVATVGGLFEVVTDWLHEADPARPRKIDSLISELATFCTPTPALPEGRDRDMIAALTGRCRARCIARQR
jgi:hypothetical protein